MDQKEIDDIIQHRIKLCEDEVIPILKATPEECSSIKISRKQFEDYIYAIGQKSMALALEVKEPTLATYDHYLGRVEGIQMVHKLLGLTKAKKIPSTIIHDDIEFDNDPNVIEYSCGGCGHGDIFEDHIYCPYCGVTFYQEDVE